MDNAQLPVHKLKYIFDNREQVAFLQQYGLEAYRPASTFLD